MIALLIISILAIASAASLILSQTQNPKPSYQAKITDFKWTSSWGPGPVGVLWGRSFNITIQNTGNRDIEGLTVDIELSANNTEIWSETGLYGPGVIGYTAEYNGFDGKFGIGEVREIRGGFMTGLDKLDQASNWGEKTFLVRIMLNQTILDSLRFPYNYS